MNIVKFVLDQLSGEALGRLSSLIGEEQEKTGVAIRAAVPAVFSVLSKLITSGSAGTEGLITALKSVEPISPEGQGGLGDLISGEGAGALLEKGSSILSSLLKGETLSALIQVLSKFTGLEGGSVKSLLGYLVPMILSVIAGQFRGKVPTADALASIFAEQRANITGAMPGGLSLAELPNLGGIGAAVSAAAADQAGGLPSWLLPVAAIVALAALGWYFLGQPAAEPEQLPPGPGLMPPMVRQDAPPSVEAQKGGVPEVLDATQLGTDLSAVYSTLTQTLVDVKDDATAEAALPKLTDLGVQIDGLKALWEKLPEAGRAAIAKITSENLAKLKELVVQVLELPGVGDKLKPILDVLLEKLATLGGT